MGLFKCHVLCVWSLVLAVVLALVPRYWELKLESIPPAPAAFEWPPAEVVEGVFDRNATLTATLIEYDIPFGVAYEIGEALQPVFDVRSIRYGNPFRLEKDFDGSLRNFEYQIDDKSVLKVERQASSYDARVEELDFDTRQAVLEAEIDSSLFRALEGVPKGEWLTMELSEIFAWDVDFNTEIRRRRRHAVRCRRALS